MSVLAQYETALPFIIGVLVLLFVVVAGLLVWRKSRGRRGAPQGPSEKSDEASSQIGIPPSAAILLEFTAESGQPIRFTWDKPAITIGRAPDNDLVLAGPVLNADTVSQHHARLRRDQDGYIIRDLGSKNGLAVNGRQTLENLLQDGDRLQLGEVEAIFHQPAESAALKCVNCGTQNTDDAKHCRRCGAVLPAAADVTAVVPLSAVNDAGATKPLGEETDNGGTKPLHNTGPKSRQPSTSSSPSSRSWMSWPRGW